MGLLNFTNLTKSTPQFPVFNASNATITPELNISMQLEWAKNMTNTTFPGILKPVYWLLSQVGDFGFLCIILMTVGVAYIKSNGNPAAVAFIALLMSAVMFSLLSALGKLVVFWIAVVSVATLLFYLYTRRGG